MYKISFKSEPLASELQDGHMFALPKMQSLSQKAFGL